MTKLCQQTHSMHHMGAQDARTGRGKRWKKHPLKAVYDAAYSAEIKRRAVKGGIKS